MSLENPDQKHLETARGYVELGMYDSANDELEDIDPFNRAAPEVLTLRIEIYRNLKKWQLMPEIARRLHEFEPNEVRWDHLACICDKTRRINRSRQRDSVKGGF
jgi:lipopolysaccharide biosynthesis regulator YciM